MSGRKKFSDLREEFLNDPERGAEHRREAEELRRAYDALVVPHETQGTPGGPVVGKDRPEGAKNRSRDSGRRGEGEQGRRA